MRVLVSKLVSHQLAKQRKVHRRRIEMEAIQRFDDLIGEDLGQAAKHLSDL
jgi:hypothetical protein